jgi:glycerol-1-phosphate dehydrogenase [NAD(P)+]
VRGDEAGFAYLKAAMARHGLAMVPADLGLTDEQFVEAVEYAPRTRPDRYTILEHLALDRHEWGARVADFVDAVRG